jgi:hypothetical protein
MKPLHARLLPAAFVLVWSSAYVAGSIATARIAPLTVTLWRLLKARLQVAPRARDQQHA